MSDFLEAVMIVCFGISWPLSLYKSYVSRTAKGKSLPFLLFILLGYGVGIINKFICFNITYVLVFYIINFTMVFGDVILYFRNKRLDYLANTA